MYVRPKYYSIFRVRNNRETPIYIRVNYAELLNYCTHAEPWVRLENFNVELEPPVMPESSTLEDFATLAEEQAIGIYTVEPDRETEFQAYGMAHVLDFGDLETHVEDPVEYTEYFTGTTVRLLSRGDTPVNGRARRHYITEGSSPFLKVFTNLEDAENYED